MKGVWFREIPRSTFPPHGLSRVFASAISAARMIPSFLTAVLWSISAVCATRSTRLLGGASANLVRLVLGTILLALWAHLFGKGLSGAGLWFFVLSGLAGFGLGDLALYEAYPRIGSRLTLLLAQCLAAPVGAVVEWL